MTYDELRQRALNLASEPRFMGVPREDYERLKLEAAKRQQHMFSPAGREGFLVTHRVYAVPCDPIENGVNSR